MKPEPYEPNQANDPKPDLFDMGRDALAAARAAFAGNAFFVSARRLQPDGSWLGPPEATLAMVEEDGLANLGGLSGARKFGANAVLCNLTPALASDAVGLGMRCLVRLPFAAGESTHVRRARLEQLVELVRGVPGIDGVLPVPMGEVQGLDALQFFAACRMACPAMHVLVDLELYGHKLGQLCLAFGADEILGSITTQRALRLGEHASSNALTCDEAALLLRASGFTPCERQSEGKVQVL
jgi:hypothetical protein